MGETASSRRYENSRPIAAPICAVSLTCVSPIQSRHQRVLQGRGNRERSQRRRENKSALLLAQQTGLKHGLGQFLHEQRHAVGLGDDFIQHFRRQRPAAGDAMDHR